MSGYFCFLGKKYDYLKEAFDVFSPHDNMDYISNFEECGIQSQISGKIWKNRCISHLISPYLRHRVYRNLVEYMTIQCKGRQIYLCVSSDRIMFMEKGFAKYLKKTIPQAYIVVFFTDNATKYSDWLPIDHLDWSDWIITYNPRDVVERGWGFFCGVNTKIYKDKKCLNNEKICDVFFCGNAKNRLNELHAVYKQLSLQGLNCLFYISGVNENDRLVETNIIYNQSLSYKEVQKKSTQARCILEISDENANGFTYRIEEAIMYNTKVITDVDFIKHFDFYSSDYILCFENLSEITREWILKPCDVDFHYDEAFGIEEFFLLLENHFSKDPVYPCTKWQCHGDEFIKMLSAEDRE